VGQVIEEEGIVSVGTLNHWLEHIALIVANVIRPRTTNAAGKRNAGLMLPPTGVSSERENDGPHQLKAASQILRG
jgi:hypothetical protein